MLRRSCFFSKTTASAVSSSSATVFSGGVMSRSRCNLAFSYSAHGGSMTAALASPFAFNSARFASSTSSGSGSFNAVGAAGGSSSSNSNNNTSGTTSGGSSSGSSAAASGPSVSPAGKVRYTDQEIRDVVRALEDNPELAVRVINLMSPAARRQLVVAGSAFEWYGPSATEAAQKEVSAADVDKDAIISSKDFDVWFERALQRRANERRLRTEAAAAAAAGGNSDSSSAAAAAAAASASTASKAAASLTFGGLFVIALEAGLPFVGFGFLDNSVMILSGDVIDRSLGAFLGCTVLASAAMGNIVSGMLGMQVHGSIERLVHVLKLPVPVLTEEQRKSRKVFAAGHLGGTLGIAIGLGLGMTPLLFMSDHAEQRTFHELDKNSDNLIDEGELESHLSRAGIRHSISKDVAANLVKKYGDGSIKGLTTAQFHKLCVDLRAQGPMAMASVKMVADS